MRFREFVRDRDGSRVMINLDKVILVEPGKGNTSVLVLGHISVQYEVAVETPYPEMARILNLERQGS